MITKNSEIIKHLIFCHQYVEYRYDIYETEN